MPRWGLVGTVWVLVVGSTLLPAGIARGDETHAVDAAERNVRGEIGLAFEKIVRKKKRKCEGDYNFLRAVVCWNAARAAQRDEAWTIAGVLLNEAHEQLTIFFERNGKKLRQDAGDRARGRTAQKTEKKLRMALYDGYLERVERTVPTFIAFTTAKDWTQVEGAVQLPLPPEEKKDER